MAAARKLQAEIDRCIKKVVEGVERHQEIWEKIRNASSINVKMTHEEDLRKETTKLLLLRSQIRTWIASPDIKDKSLLLEKQKLIEMGVMGLRTVARSPLQCNMAKVDKEKTPSPTTTKRVFSEVNDRQVDEIALEVFYKPHTITLLLGCVALLTFLAFSRDPNTDIRGNLLTGCGGVFIFFMVISVLAFPNGPLIRPHPILWRMVFGCSVLYLLIVQFLIHQDYHTVRSLIVWIDPSMANYTIDMEKEYGQHCWDITFERIWSHFDWFAFGHYWGWGMKALVLRHYGMCWMISIMWELTEMVFGHLLPNFYECWWDNLVLDVLLCNGLGIFTGMQVCKWFEMREHHWESITNISSTKGKIKRALLQFTPESFSSTRWLDPECSWMRFFAIFQLVLVFQIVELNTFFVKHFFPMPAEHPICVFRILLSGLMAAPAIRQYYTYVTDRRCKRLGSQAWVFIFLAFSELILNIKFGLDVFSKTQISKMILWILLNIAISILGIVISMKIYRWRYRSVITISEETKTK